MSKTTRRAAPELLEAAAAPSERTGRKLVGRKMFAEFLLVSVDTLERRAVLVDPRHFGVSVNGQWEGWEDQARAWDEVASREARRHPEARRISPWRPPEAPGLGAIRGR